MSNLNKQRIFVASLISPLLPGLFFIILASKDPHPAWRFYFMMYIFSAVCGYFGLFIIGFPAIKFLRYFGILNLPLLILFRALGGIVAFCSFILVLGVMLQSSGSFGIMQIIWGAIFGGVVSLCFGLVAGITLRSSGTLGIRS
jgi:hypothetical protein